MHPFHGHGQRARECARGRIDGSNKQMSIVNVGIRKRKSNLFSRKLVLQYTRSTSIIRDHFEPVISVADRNTMVAGEFGLLMDVASVPGKITDFLV